MIVSLTASALDHERWAAAQVGADAFRAKTCRENELLAKMRALLNITYDDEEIKRRESQLAAREVRWGNCRETSLQELADKYDTMH